MSRKRSAAPVTGVADLPDETPERRRKREEWERCHAEERRLRDSARRKLCNAFKIWTVCPHKICRRHRGCSGDTGECISQRWRHLVPEELRIYTFKVMHLVSAQGMSVEQACDTVEADLKHRAEIAAGYEAQAAARSNSP